MAAEFYRQRVGQHLEIGLAAIEKLKSQDWERLHSRKLRSFAEVAFQ
jgi:AMP nucleosidase